MLPDAKGKVKGCYCSWVKERQRGREVTGTV